MRKPLLAVWRDALRESSLTGGPSPSLSIVKLVGHTLATYMDASGVAWPSRQTLAQGASLGLRSVDAAIAALEAAGFVVIERTRGGSSHRYQATLPPTAQEMRRSEWSTAQEMRRSESLNGASHDTNGASHDTNRARRAPESVESAESGALNASVALTGTAAARCPECEVGGGRHAADCATGGAA